MAIRVLDPDPDCICVIDSSLLIRLKELVSVAEQWDLLTKMMRMVEGGEICFPRQVANELIGGKWPDAPGAWVGSAKNSVCHRQPSDNVVSHVLARQPHLIDHDSLAEQADPYVVGMALEVADAYPGSRVVVASDDKVDRLPLKTSILSACAAFRIDMWEPDEFIEWCGSR